MTTMIDRPTAPPGVNLTEDEQEAMTEIESVIKNCELAFSDAGGKIGKMFAMAQGIEALRKLITDEMMNKYIMPLMNTRLGFKTDQDPNRKRYDGKESKPYPVAVVKDCTIEALLRGANVVGNEFNIISAQTYFTREFFERALGELPNVTNIVASPGIPRFESGLDGKVIKALIRFGLSWKVGGTSDCLRDAEGKPGRVFEIKADNWSSADQVIGKATRKAYAAAYKQINGSELAPADGDVEDAQSKPIVATVTDVDPPKDRASQLADTLAGKSNGGDTLGVDPRSASTAAPVIKTEQEGNEQIERKAAETRAAEAAKTGKAPEPIEPAPDAKPINGKAVASASHPLLPTPAEPEWIAKTIAELKRPEALSFEEAQKQVLTYVRTKIPRGWANIHRDSQEVWYRRWMNGEFQWQLPEGTGK